MFSSCKKNETKQVELKSESDGAPKEIVAAIKPETATFNIEGMTCAVGCAKTIEKELSAMDGIQKATVDFDKKTAFVAFDATKQTPEKLLKTVENTGDGKTYTVSNMKSSSDKATN